MDDDELARNHQEVSTFTTIMAPLVQSALARVAAATPTKPLRPFSANTMLVPKHRSPPSIIGPTLVPMSPSVGHTPIRPRHAASSPNANGKGAASDDQVRGAEAAATTTTAMMPLTKPRPNTAAKMKSQPKSNQVDVDRCDATCAGGLPVLATKKAAAMLPPTRPRTAARQLHSPCNPGKFTRLTTSTASTTTSNALQRAKLLANKLRPKSAIVQPSSMATVHAKKKRPRPPSAWLMIQSQAATESLGPLSPTGEVDKVSIDLTKQEVIRQRDVTASAYKVFNDIKHTRDSKMVELSHLHRQVALLSKEMTATSSETSAATTLSSQTRLLQLQIAHDKDQSNKCRQYKRVLEHMLERTKLDAAAIVARTKVTRHHTLVVEKEWRALDSRKYTLENAAAHTLKRLDQLRLDQSAKRDDQAATLKCLRSEAEQSQELHRRRVEADRKRRNLVMTFRSPHGGNARPSLSRMDTHLLLLRESALTSREAEFDWLVDKTGETDVTLLLDRFVQHDHDMEVLRQLDADGVAAHMRLDKEHARLQAEVYELRTCGSDQVMDAQRKVKGMLEDELWVAQANEESAREEMHYHQAIVTAMHQGLHSILQWLQCVDPMGCSEFKSQPLETLPLLCIQLVQTHLAGLEMYSTQALQELLEKLPVSLWPMSQPHDSVTDDGVDTDESSHQSNNYENAARQSHAARILEPETFSKQDTFQNDSTK